MSPHRTAPLKPKEGLNGPPATNVNYDAMGRMAENGVSAFKQFIYAAGGTTPFAQLNTSSTLVQAPLPGGGFVVYNGSSISQYNHPDWLGSARLITTPAHTVVEDTGYAPFGEAYDGNANGWFQFTSNGMWTITGSNNSGLDDFMYRRYSSTQSRWISPDPAGLAAVDPSNPQTWNRYAYVGNNPMTSVDPTGLEPDLSSWGTCIDAYNGCTPLCDP